MDIEFGRNTFDDIDAIKSRTVNAAHAANIDDNDGNSINNDQDLDRRSEKDDSDANSNKNNKSRENTATQHLGPLRQYHSESVLTTGPSVSTRSVHFANDAKIPPSLLGAKSEPILSARRPHPLMDTLEETVPNTCDDLLLAADTLENIVNEGTFVGTIRSRLKFLGRPLSRNDVGGAGSSASDCREMSDRVLRLVYSTMKFLPYIDQILVKTQFLVFNNQFLDSLGLVKVMLYDLMRHHFDYRTYPGIDYGAPNNQRQGSEATLNETDMFDRSTREELVRELDTALRAFQIKLAAAYARLRIEKQAAGSTTWEQMENILPEDVRKKEQMAVDMPKTLRMNLDKASRDVIMKMLDEQGFGFVTKPVDGVQRKSRGQQTEDPICLDEDFDDLLVVPSRLFSEIKASTLVSEGYLIFQDKASMYGTHHLRDLVSQGTKLIDARAGCGIKTMGLSTLVGKKGHVYAFEMRGGRLETLKTSIKTAGCSNVTVVEEDFAISDPHDARFADVTTIVIEPPNSGTAIVDKLGFMLQEEEFPSDQHSLKDLYALKRQQVAILKHAFKFPNVNVVMYITRSIHTDENEQVVCETLDRYGVDWELSCVLPNVVVEKQHDYEIDECFTARPSEQDGNGVFVACFRKKVSIKIDDEEIDDEADEEIDEATGLPRRMSNMSLGEREPRTGRRGSLSKRGRAGAPMNDGSGTVRRRRRRRSGLPAQTQNQSGNLMHTHQHHAPKRITPYIRLPKAISESVERLSIPRIQLLEQKQKLEAERIAQLRERIARGAARRGSDAQAAAHANGDDEGADTDRNHQSHRRQSNIDLGISGEFNEDFDLPHAGRSSITDVQFADISIFGLSLAKFFGPRVHALKKINPDLAVPSRWRYPVPNPRPWK